MDSRSSVVAPETLALQLLYRWEKTEPDRVVMTQPQGDGTVREYTWRQVMDQSRRMAAHLLSLGYEPGSRIALLSKNCAHWLICDFAIWMAGQGTEPYEQDTLQSPGRGRSTTPHAVRWQAMAHENCGIRSACTARLRSREGLT